MGNVINMRKDISLDEFIKEVASQIAILQVDASDVIHSNLEVVNYNNQVTCSALRLQRENDEAGILIQIDAMYQEYKKGREIDDCIQELLEIYMQQENVISFRLEEYKEYDKIRNHIKPALINWSKNRDELENIPYAMFGDLAIIFQVQLIVSQSGDGTVIIDNRQLSIWGIEKDILMQQAMKNLIQDQTIVIENMAEYCDISVENIHEMKNYIHEPEIEQGIYVMTSHCFSYGAVTILNENLVHDFAEKMGCSLYIIPSSVHETILLPNEGSLALKDIQNLVTIMNKNKIEPEYILSDNIYQYDKDNRSYSFADSGLEINIQDIENVPAYNLANMA